MLVPSLVTDSALKLRQETYRSSRLRSSLEGALDLAGPGDHSIFQQVQRILVLVDAWERSMAARQLLLSFLIVGR